MFPRSKRGCSVLTASTDQNCLAFTSSHSLRYIWNYVPQEPTTRTSSHNDHHSPSYFPSSSHHSPSPFTSDQHGGAPSRARKPSAVPLSDYAEVNGPSYSDNIVAEYADKKPTRLTLKTLLEFGKKIDDVKILASARYLHKELPIRLAHRIADMNKLPYIVGCNPYVKKVYGLYYSHFNQYVFVLSFRYFVLIPPKL